MFGFDPHTGKSLPIAFEMAKTKASIAFVSGGRSVILIVDGREYDFPFTGAFTEEMARATMRQENVRILREDEPLRVVQLLQLVGMAVLLLVLIIG